MQNQTSPAHRPGAAGDGAPRFYSLWAINGPLDPVRLRRQLDQLQAAGLDGVVFHPRFYPNDPPYLGGRYLQVVSDAILHARAIGLGFWIYDENGWPSGTVGGQMLQKYPDHAQRWAELVTRRPARCLMEFERAGTRWYLAERTGNGVDYFNPDLTRHFIELTHEQYRASLAPAAWEHVAAFFSDEPEFGLGHAYDALSPHGAIPWTPALPEQFRQRHGGDLLPLIPEIFFPGDGPGRAGNPAAGGGEVRVKFWELLTDLFNESFTAPINDWCARHGKRFTAHVKGEEHPLFQVPTSGSCHQFFRHLSLPGIDALERHPANDFFPRQVSSAARQFGDGRCMVEAFGGAGWGATPADLENYLLWLGRNGLTDFVLHLSQYRLDSAAMHDWPPSQPLHLAWRDAYPEVLRRVRRELQRQPRPAAATLVIAPHRGIMAAYPPTDFLQTNVHNAATYPDSVAGKINRRFLARVAALQQAGVNFDVADERTLEQCGRRVGHELVLGHCTYRQVIVDEDCRLGSLAAGFLPPVEPWLAQPGETDTPIARPLEIIRRADKSRAHPQPAAFNVVWSLEKHPCNLFRLECAAEAGGWWVADFAGSAPLPDARLELIFADEIAAAEIAGHPLTPLAGDDGASILVDPALIQAANTLRFRPVKPGGQPPFAWLRGGFRVGCASPFVAGPHHTLKTAGPFTLQPARPAVQRDLVADGFPFLRDPLVLAADIPLPKGAAGLRFDGVVADAVRLWIGGHDLGWSWPAAGEIAFAVNLPAGTHRARLELVPNTFNAFGPHHYYGGDWPVVSPDQIRGVRNFADPGDAPAHTHVAAWHFRRFQLPDTTTAI